MNAQPIAFDRNLIDGDLQIAVYQDLRGYQSVKQYAPADNVLADAENQQKNGLKLVAYFADKNAAVLKTLVEAVTHINKRKDAELSDRV